MGPVPCLGAVQPGCGAWPVSLTPFVWRYTWHFPLLRGKRLWGSSSHCRFAANMYGGLIIARTVLLKGVLNPYLFMLCRARKQLSIYVRTLFLIFCFCSRTSFEHYFVFKFSENFISVLRPLFFPSSEPRYSSVISIVEFLKSWLNFLQDGVSEKLSVFFTPFLLQPCSVASLAKEIHWSVLTHLELLDIFLSESGENSSTYSCLDKQLR